MLSSAHALFLFVTSVSAGTPGPEADVAADHKAQQLAQIIKPAMCQPIPQSLAKSLRMIYRKRGKHGYR